MFWFKVHTFLDTALEPSRGRISFPTSSIWAGLSDSLLMNRIWQTWLHDFKDGTQKTTRLQTFSFGLLTLASVNHHVVRILKQPCGEIHVLRPLFLPKPSKELRLLDNSYNGRGSSTWRLTLRLQMTTAWQTA